MASILVVDDESAFRESFCTLLEDLGHGAASAASANEALRLLGVNKYHLVFLDFRMPGTSGLQLMRLVRDRLGDAAPPIIMLTAFSDSQNTIEAMRLGAFDHLAKPISRNAIQAALKEVFAAYPEGSREPSGAGVRAEAPHADDLLIGESPAMRQVWKSLGRVSATESTTLILGETGTGKEMVAKAIHKNSARAAGTFVAVNCAAIPESLLESELFGHLRGSFTGAALDRAGSFQQADGGTLFLDEIGDMNLALQAKILRAVQEREVTPLGAKKAVKVDVRILAATHQNLGAMVEQRLFREDLYYRLNVLQLTLPPLRDRKEDIAPLSAHFLRKSGEGRRSLSEGALRKLEEHSWPGNVRELKNVIERAAVSARGLSIEPSDIHFIGVCGEADEAEDSGLTWFPAIARLEKKMLAKALTEADGNRSEAARRLGIQRQLLYAKMKEHSFL